MHFPSLFSTGLFVLDLKINKDRQVFNYKNLCAKACSKGTKINVYECIWTIVQSVKNCIVYVVTLYTFISENQRDADTGTSALCNQVCSSYKNHLGRFITVC